MSSPPPSDEGLARHTLLPSACCRYFIFYSIYSILVLGVSVADDDHLSFFWRGGFLLLPL